MTAYTSRIRNDYLRWVAFPPAFAISTIGYFALCLRHRSRPNWALLGGLFDAGMAGAFIP